MKRSRIAIAVATAMFLTAGNAVAQKGQGGPKGPKVKATQPAPKTKTTTGGPKLHASAGQGPKVKSTTTHSPKAQTAATKTKGPDRTGTTAATTTTTSAGTTLTLSPVQQKLQKNTNLASKLEGRLPGTNLLDAAEGFRNLGQFVAAVNVAHNLDISFAELKVRMVDDGMSLGQAIKAERNDVNVTTEVARAERDAQILIADTDEVTKKKDAKPAKAKKRDGR